MQSNSNSPPCACAFSCCPLLVQSQGHNDEAIKCIEKACALDPDNMDLVALLGTPTQAIPSLSYLKPFPPQKTRKPA